MSKIPASLLIIIGIAFIAGSGWWFWVDDIKPYLNKNKEALIQKCPDGSFVDEFGKCPGGSSSTSLGTIDNIADWQTYRNEKYGFEVKYPQRWANDDKQSSNIWVNFGPDSQAFNNDGNKRYMVIDSGCIFATGFEGFEITKRNRQISLGGNTFEETMIYPSGSDESESLLHNFSIPFPNNWVLNQQNNCHTLGFILYDFSDMDTIYQILSTFKFIEERSKEVILSVDKNSYQAGEKIIITLKNNSGDTFAYSPYGTGCATPRGEWWSLQYFDAKNGGWLDITTECRIRYMDCEMPSPEKRSGIKFQLLPGKSLTDSYNTGNYNTKDYRRSFCVFGKEGDINSGTFRIKSLFDKKEIYSEPFEIRNLSEEQSTPPDYKPKKI